MPLTTIPADKVQFPLEGGYYHVPTALSDSASVTPDFSLNNVFTWTITQNATLEFPSTVPGAGVWHIYLTQDVVGEHTLALASGYHLIEGTVEPSASAETIITIISDGSGTDLDVFYYEQTATATADYVIPWSCRFNDDDSAYLLRTPGTSGNRRTWTWSGWAKRGNIDTASGCHLFGTDRSGGFGDRITTGNGDDNDYLHVMFNDASAGSLRTTALFRDPSSWYHIVVAVDTTQATDTERVKIFVNGERITDFSTETYPTQNYDTMMNHTVLQHVGSRGGSASQFWDGYMAEVHMVDGLALSADNFGEFNDKDVWIPKQVNTRDWPGNFDLVPQATGTAQGDMTNGGGLSVSFDGDATETNANASQSPAASQATGYIGKDYGAGNEKVIVKMIAKSSTNAGWDSNWASTCTLSVWGSNEASPTYASDTGWTQLSSQSVVSINSTQNTNIQQFNSDGVAYRHIKLKGVTGVTGDGGNYFSTSEVEFYENRPYGQNGFYMDFSDNSSADALGTDVSKTAGTLGFADSSFWQGNVSEYTFASGNIDKNTTSTKAIRTVQTLSGNFNVSFDLVDADGTLDAVEEYFGFYDPSDTWSDASSAGGITGGTNYFISQDTNFQTDFHIYKDGAAVVSNVSWTSGDTVEWDRTDGVVTFKKNGVTEYTDSSPTLTGPVYVFLQLYDGATVASADNISGTGRPGNSFTTSGLATTDQMTDSPTVSGTSIGNWPIINPLDGKNHVFSEGNLRTQQNGTEGTHYANIGVNSGKWYWEQTYTGVLNSIGWGVSTEERKTATSNTIPGYNVDYEWGVYIGNGNKYHNDTGTSYGSALVSGDTVMCALDVDNGKIWFGKEGTWFASGNPAAGTNAAFTNLPTDGTFMYPMGNITTSVTDRWDYNFGQKAFTGTVPTGFSTLSPANLPAPAITKPSNYFDTVLYTGNGVDDTRIWRQDFQPDLVWIKSRDNTNNHQLFDTVRGASVWLKSDGQDAEAADATRLKAFDPQGFTIGTHVNVNEDGLDFVAWTWKKDATAGFDIQTYSGTGTSGLTVNHDLGVKPEFMIVKNRATGTTDWAVYHRMANSGTNPEQYFGWLNSANTFTNTGGTGYWNDTAPTTTQFTLGNDGDVNSSGTNNHIAYLWAGVEGFSKFGGYTGNANADGPFVYTGFKPALIIGKNANSGADNWWAFDNKRSPSNVVDGYLTPTTNAAETTSAWFDFTSNGFKIRDNGNGPNGSGNTILYAAFAEDPFNTSRAR